MFYPCYGSSIFKQSKTVCPESANLEHFFDGLSTLKQEEADTCEALLTLEECTNSLNQFKNNKTPGSDGFTIEFYRFFWNTIGPVMVGSFKLCFWKWWNVNLTKTLYYIANTKERQR